MKLFKLRKTIVVACFLSIGMGAVCASAADSKGSKVTKGKKVTKKTTGAVLEKPVSDGGNASKAAKAIAAKPSSIKSSAKAVDSGKPKVQVDAKGAAAMAKPMQKLKPKKEKSMGKARDSGGQVSWFLPEISRGGKKGMVNILLSGKTLAKTQVKINLKSVLVQEKGGDGDFESLKYDNKKDHVNVTSDRYGFFSLEIPLPPKQSQVPVEFKFPSGKVRSFQIGLDVARQKVKMESKGRVIKSTPLFFEKYGFWAGLGVNYLKYEQKTPSLGWDLDFQTFSGPSIYFNAYDFFTPEWKGTVALKASPGATSSSDVITINGGDYYWLIFSGEMTYYKDTWRYRLSQKYPTQWGLRVGFQHHIMPFLENVAVDTGEIKTNGVTMITVGGEWNIKLDKKWIFQTFLRWQTPVATGDRFNVVFDYGFDGSVGASYDFGNRWQAGVYWYGQIHSYGFKHDNDFKATKLTGEQLLFFSNIDVRGGYTF